MVRYKILSATATASLERAVNEAMEAGWFPLGSPQGNLGQGFMQAVYFMDLGGVMGDEDEEKQATNE